MPRAASMARLTLKSHVVVQICGSPGICGDADRRLGRDHQPEPAAHPGAQAHAAWNAAVALWEGPKVPAMAGSEDDWTDGPC
jgi:hypothetical protein